MKSESKSLWTAKISILDREEFGEVSILITPESFRVVTFRVVSLRTSKNIE